jgi:YHS domain-containing protein
MADIQSLLGRIDAEFSAVKDRIQQAQADYLHKHHERQERLAKFEALLAELQAVWKPRLDALMQKFGDKVEVTPHVTATGRDAIFKFTSNLASIRLRLSASTDREVRNLILDYNLEIVPILMKFDSHQQAEWPLDAVDKEAVGNWVEDRIIDFVKTYLSLHENEYYLKDHMVEDPIAKVRFLKYAAGATMEKNGKTIYFISEETRKDFEKQSK